MLCSMNISHRGSSGRHSRQLRGIELPGTAAAADDDDDDDDDGD